VGVATMLKQNWRVISNIERVVDNLIIVAVFFLTYRLRDILFGVLDIFSVTQGDTPTTLAPIEDYFIVLGIALPLYNALLSMMGAYQSMRFSSLWKLFKIAFVSSVSVFLLEGSILYLLKLPLSRSFVGMFCLFCGAALFLERVIGLGLLRYFRASGRNFRNLLIAGTGEQARKVYDEIASRPDLGIKVVGFVSLTEDEDWSKYTLLPRPVVASPSTYEAALKRHTIDEVLFTDFIPYFVTVEGLVQITAEEGVRVTIAADIFSLEIFKSRISYFGDIPLIYYQPSHGDSPALAAKRLIDVSASFLLLIGLSPLMIMVALLIKLDSPGPVFFKQRRVGVNGRKFILLKFRSMVVDAERLLPKLIKKNEMQGPVFKLKNDPRVTRVGHWIRRFSIDELPQLINVLLGDMSLVGPRPPLPEEVSMYIRKHRRRLSMRPGLTCTWQVSGRNQNPDFDKWMEQDLEYIDNWSLAKDMKLLAKTIPAVILGTGAR
jgi:exopolysaccharide biosynthesis polyprenyl glycosylphosphotransferase